MAKLVTTNQKYGVSIAARIDAELAHQIAERAESLGISMAKMVGMLITKGMDDSAHRKEDHSQTIREVEILYKKTTADFIKRIAPNDRALEYSDLYKELLKIKRNE